MLLVVMFVVVVAISLPFLLVNNDLTRKRIFMPLSAVPTLLVCLFYWWGFNAYVIALLGFVWIAPVSWALFIVGITLAVRAWSRDEEWKGLAWGVLLASSPVILFFGMFFIGMLLNS
jgi:hypothetical protein